MILTVPVFVEALPTQGCRGVAHRCTQCNQADHMLSGDLVPCEMLGRSCFQLCDRSCVRLCSFTSQTERRWRQYGRFLF